MNSVVLRQPLFLISAAAVLLITVYPIVWLFIGSISDSSGAITGKFYGDALTAFSNLETIKNSLILAGFSIPLALIIGIFSAVSIVRLDIPLKGFVRMASIVAFVSPPWIAAMAYAYLMSPNSGALNNLMDAFAGLRPFNIFSMSGMVFVTTLFLYPYIFLTVSSSLANIDSSYEEAAITTGCSPLRTMLTITIPLVTPAIVTGTVFSLIMVWSLYSVPALLGMPSKIYVFATYLFFLLNGFPPRLELASAIAVIFAVLAGGLVWLGFRLARRAQTGRFQVVGGKGHKRLNLRIGALRYPIAAMNLLIVLTAIILPYAIVLYMSLANNVYAPSLALSDFTFLHYLTELGSPDMGRIVVNTLVLAAASAGFGCLIAVLIAYYEMRMPSKASSILALISMFPVAVPAVAFAIGVTWAFIQPPFVLYGTLTIMAIAQIARFLPLGTQHFRDGLNQLHPSLEEAAKVCGASSGITLLRISLPLMKPVIVATFLVLFMSSMRDLLTPVFLGSGTSSTTVMAARIFFMWGEGQMAQAAAGTILYVIVMGAVYAVIWFLMKRTGGQPSH